MDACEVCGGQATARHSYVGYGTVRLLCGPCGEDVAATLALNNPNNHGRTCANETCGRPLPVLWPGCYCGTACALAAEAEVWRLQRAIKAMTDRAPAQGELLTRRAEGGGDG